MNMVWIEKRLMNSPVRRLIWNRFEMPIIKSLIPHLAQGSKCLEIGSGSGYGSISLVREFPGIKLTATDLDEAQIEEAERNIGRAGLRGRIELKQADATNLPFPAQSFDLVVCYGALHHIPEYEKAIQEMFRVLKQGSKLLVAEPPQQLFKHIIKLLFPPEATFTMDQIRSSLLQTGFKIETVYDRVGTLGLNLMFYILANKTLEQ